MTSKSVIMLGHYCKYFRSLSILLHLRVEQFGMGAFFEAIGVNSDELLKTVLASEVCFYQPLMTSFW